MRSRTRSSSSHWVCWIPVFALAIEVGYAAAPQEASKLASSSEADVQDPPCAMPVLFERSNYSWPFAKGPYYGDVPDERRNATGVLHTAVGSLELGALRMDFPPELQATLPATWIGQRHFLMQIEPAALTDGRFETIDVLLRTTGGEMIRPLPVAAWLVRMDATGYAATRMLSGVLAIEPYHPALKLAPTIGRIPLPDRDKAESESFELDVVLFAGSDPAIVSSTIEAFGGRVTRVSSDHLRIVLHRDRLPELARIEAVESVSEHAPILRQGEQAIDTLQTGDPTNVVGLDGGDLFTSPTGGSLYDAHTRGARTFNISWGTVSNPTYAANAQKIDSFLFTHPDSMAFVAVGNERSLGASTVSDPAIAKNAVTVGALGSACHLDDRWAGSSQGPATTASERVAPLLMAPGADREAAGANLRLAGSHDGASFASSVAAEAAMLVRDYFAHGPSGSAQVANRTPAISGALVKAALVASAEWVAKGSATGENLTKPYRFNDEQGYGRIELTKALPLNNWTGTPSEILVSDGGLGVGMGRVDISSLGGSLPGSVSQSGQVNVSRDDRELRVALAWIEDRGEILAKDIDLELVSPSGITYYGNYFTDDNDKSGTIDLATENCDYAALIHWPTSSTNRLDASPWSLPTCIRSGHDKLNPTEAIFLSPDPAGNGIYDDPATAVDEGQDNQIEVGSWAIHLISGAYAGSQRYALVVVGGLRLQSTITLDRQAYDCNDDAQIDISESSDPGDPAPSAATVQSRVKLEVFGNSCPNDPTVTCSSGIL